MLKLLRRAWYAIRQPQFHAELAEEMELHRELKQAELERSGLPPADAKHASRRALGNQTLAHEDARAVWVSRWLDDLWRDLVYASRTLKRNPAFGAVVVLTLALGIGAKHRELQRAERGSPATAAVREPGHSRADLPE